MARITRETTCPGCGVKVVMQNCRPDATRQKFCESCINHENHRIFRTMNAKYDISYAALDTIYSIKNCECCGRILEPGGGPGQGSPNKRQIDHCHATGKVRGVLCWDCNSAIGKLGDDLQGVEKALAYLKQAEEKKYEARF